MKEKKNLSQTKVYYSVLTACLLLIVGISAVIYNFNLAKLPQPAQDETTPSAVTDEQVNVTATGIPKTTSTTVSTTTTTTVPSHLLPYTGEFMPPTSGKVINDYSNGEMVKNETMGDWRVHNGVDFSASDAQQVVAVQDSTVTKIDKDPMWGVIVEISCPEGLTVRYCGLQDNVSVKKGDTLKKGDVIGFAGNIPVESAEDKHIHLEAFINGKSVDPIDALNLM